MEKPRISNWTLGQFSSANLFWPSLHSRIVAPHPPLPWRSLAAPLSPPLSPASCPPWDVHSGVWQACPPHPWLPEATPGQVDTSRPSIADTILASLEVGAPQNIIFSPTQWEVWPGQLTFNLSKASKPHRTAPLHPKRQAGSCPPCLLAGLLPKLSHPASLLSPRAPVSFTRRDHLSPMTSVDPMTPSHLVHICVPHISKYMPLRKSTMLDSNHAALKEL